MDIYGLVKALSNYGSPPVGERLYSGLSFTVHSFDCVWEIQLNLSTVTMKLVEGESHVAQGTINSISTSPYLLTCCWIMVREFWPELYNEFAKFQPEVSTYTIDLLKTLTSVVQYNSEWATLYLFVFAALSDHPIGREDSLNSIKMGRTDLCLKHCASDLELSVNDSTVVDWAYMGRNLWRHLVAHFTPPLEHY